MTDTFLARAARIFGGTPYDVHWPYDVNGIDYSQRRTDPERFRTKLAELEAKRLVLVEWAEPYDLRAARGCCPRWLLKNASHRCGHPYVWTPDLSTRNCTWGTDERWLDHPIWWVKDRRPVAVTGAPYHFDDTSRARVNHWLGFDPRLAFATGTGWYGHGTIQTLLWRTDRIAKIAPANPKNGAAT